MGRTDRGGAANGKLILCIEIASELHLQIPMATVWLFFANHLKVASLKSK
jgi:hypothetical protein